MNILRTVFTTVLVIIGFQINVYAVEPAIIDDDITFLNISKFSEYAVLPPEYDTTINDITAPTIKWKQISTNNLTVPNGRQQHWLRFSLMNTGNMELKLFLELDSPFINRIYFYIQNDDGTYYTKTSGFLFPYNTREVKDRNYIFKINLSPGVQTYYLRIEDEEPLNCNMKLMSENGYNSKLKKELPFFWAFYGLMGAMIIYNLFIFFSTREKAHIYYVMFISVATLFCFMNNGFGSQYIWRNNVFMALNSLIVTWSLLPGTAWLYVSAHDDVKCKSRRIYHMGLFFIEIPSWINATISLYIAKLGMASPQIFMPFILYLSILSLIAVIFALTYLPYSAFVLKSRTARNILAAFSCILLFVPITLMAHRGIIPPHFFIQHAYQFGFAAMTLLLSFGLADKINIMKNELKTKLDDQMALEQSRRKLKYTEEQYRTIFENALEGIFQVTYENRSTHNEGHFINVNPAMIRTMGYDSLADLNETVTSFSKDFFINSIDRDNLFNMITQMGQAIGFEVQLRRKNGSLFWATLSARDVRDDNNEHLYYEGTLVDITDRKKREEAEKNYETAVAASHAKSEFLAGMSHEIRTPMNAIIGFTNLALQTQLTPKQYDYISKIKMSGESLLGIINDILDFSKIEAGKLDLENIAFNLKSVTNQVVDLFAGKVAEKKIKMTASIAEDVPCSLIGDSLRLRQILTNLAGNAVKFTDEGEVSIHVSLEERNPHRARLKFTVTDTGIGLSKEQIADIFTSYTQADTSTSRKFGGTGLGLTISKRLVELMNGKIWVESTLEKGSCFFFIVEFEYLPAEKNHVHEAYENSVSQPEEEAELQPTQKAIEMLQDKRVLVVDDNDINRQVAEEILSQAGIIVHTVKNGQEALEAATSYKFDAILMDIEMPVMNGYEATYHIRNTLFLIKLPIIAMTAHAIQGYKEECLRAGMNDYITKPIDHRVLLLTLSDHIQKNNPKIETSPLPHKQEKISHNSNNSDLYRNSTEIDIDGALGRMDGDRKLLLKVLEMFAVDYSGAHIEIKEMLKSGDMEGAKRWAHSVKGAASNFGAEELCIVAEKLENTIRKGDSDNFNHLMSDFEIKLQRVITAIERIEK